MPRHVQISPFSGSDLTSSTLDLQNCDGWSFSVRRTLAEASGITLQLSINESNWSVNRGYHNVDLDLEEGPRFMPFARFLRSNLTYTVDVNLVEG